ncbi:conserved hypothetical protein [Methylobacterium sp. 4-46]|uniref:hypothetical protein n=1 Tax=unclassified Methylobacterium TaxID=2615210 RepID=UPI000165C90B|nr:MULTISPECIES: hypothetical protein [Methylobacterium]ACA17857.1 conserved hypothetical protein [Methylobacterium sp. 4-46]WFT77159.1 hypothetical protein QA634_17590 [Methylobacterium nodulans]
MRTPALAPTLATLLALALGGAALAPLTAARAQEAGPNGGQVSVADGHPIEMVAAGTALTFHLLGEDGKPVDTKGLSARAFVQSGGRTETVALTPAAPNRLVGTLAAPLAAGKVVLSTRIHGHALQARYETK